MSEDKGRKKEVNFRSLADCVAKGDHIGFLRSYMQLVIAGKDLSVPTSLERTIVYGAWQTLLLGVPGGDSKTFLDKLTLLWLNVMQRQGGEISETFAREVLAILENDSAYLTKVKQKAAQKSPTNDNKPPQKPSTPKSVAEYQPKMKSIQPEPLDEKSRSKRRSPKLETVQSDISKNYYDEVDEENVSIPEATHLPKLVKESYETKNVDAFLKSFLSGRLTHSRLDLPLTSVLDVAFHKWKDLILVALNTVPDDKFVRAVSERWYYLMNHYGLPTDRKKVKKLIAVLDKEGDSLPQVKQAKSGQKKAKKNEGFWGTVQGMFS